MGRKDGQEEMSYTDAEMQIASLIAYLDIPAGVSLGRYMDTHSGDSRVQKIREIAANTRGDESAYDNWRIVGVGDDQDASGMYGCMIDDGQGSAIVAFRGSESDNMQKVITDWLGADAGLLNSAETWQQHQAEEFVKQMYERFGDEYDSFAFTGHSLGGNLAIDAALDAPDGMRDKITQIVGLDSPGFSDEYLAVHAMRIAEMQGRIDHYQWSAVGALLYTPGRTRTVNVDDMGNDCFGRHALANLNTDGGYVSDRPGGPTPDEIALMGTAIWADHSLWGNLISGISKISQGINQIANWGNDMRVSTASGTNSPLRFEVNIPALLALSEQYGDIEEDLRQAQSILDDIENTIKYRSAVGWLVKHKISKEKVRVEELANLLGKHCTILENASNYYRQADLDAEAAYDKMFISGRTTAGTEGTV